MKALKIELSNTTAIESALHSVNGRSASHSYTTFEEVVKISERFEQRVYDILGSKKEMVGAVVRSESGSSVAKSYKGKRASTVVVLERKSTGWFLVSINRGELWNDGGREYLTLTAAQDARAVEVLRKNYAVSMEA
jgi:hypothetical protein